MEDAMIVELEQLMLPPAHNGHDGGAAHGTKSVR